MGTKRRWSRATRRSLAMAAAACALLLGLAAPAVAAQARVAAAAPGATATEPAVTGPVTGGQGVIQLAGTTLPLSSIGYTQS